MTWVHASGPRADLRVSQDAHARALKSLGPLPKLPSTSGMLVGACMTLATGVGLALKMSRSRSVAVCFFGDAASTNGAFHEALTMASIYRVPVLFVCENNGYSTNSPAMEYMPTVMVGDRA